MFSTATALKSLGCQVMHYLGYDYDGWLHEAIDNVLLDQNNPCQWKELYLRLAAYHHKNDRGVDVIDDYLTILGKSNEEAIVFWELFHATRYYPKSGLRTRSKEAREVTKSQFDRYLKEYYAIEQEEERFTYRELRDYLSQGITSTDRTSDQFNMIHHYLKSLIEIHWNQKYDFVFDTFVNIEHCSLPLHDHVIAHLLSIAMQSENQHAFEKLLDTILMIYDKATSWFRPKPIEKLALFDMHEIEVTPKPLLGMLIEKVRHDRRNMFLESFLKIAFKGTENNIDQLIAYIDRQLIHHFDSACIQDKIIPWLYKNQEACMQQSRPKRNVVW